MPFLVCVMWGGFSRWFDLVAVLWFWRLVVLSLFVVLNSCGVWCVAA